MVTWLSPKVRYVFFMLNSVKHKILNAHKYKTIKKFDFFIGSDKPRILLFPLKHVNCWHFIIHEQEKFHAKN